MRLLLLSNSTNYGESYLAFCRNNIRGFLQGSSSEVIFIPFAAIRIPWAEYENKVNEALLPVEIRVKSIHHFKDKIDALQKASAIIVGGGNTFRLLELIYEMEIFDVLREKIKSGIPYLGWSAGINIVCPTIQTTNDMPVTIPRDFKALNLLSCQLNPHYTEGRIPGHGGESRDERILEYLEMNPDKMVMGIPEGVMVEINGTRIRLIGDQGVKIFRSGRAAEWVKDPETFNSFSNLLNG